MCRRSIYNYRLCVDGTVATLRRASPGGERFVSTPFFTSVSGKRLFLVSVRTDTAGGRRGAGHDRARENFVRDVH